MMRGCQTFRNLYTRSTPTCGALSDDIDKADARVSDIERQVIQATANQSAVEAVMGSENRRLTDKIELVHDAVDRVDSKFGEHIRREDADRRAMLSGIWSLAIAVVTAILGAGWWLVTKAQ